MTGTRYYIVAEHTFCIKAADSILALMQNYEPFRTAPNEDILFEITVTDVSPVRSGARMRKARIPFAGILRMGNRFLSSCLEARQRDGWFAHRDTGAQRFTLADSCQRLRLTTP